MDTAELHEFLKAANKATYANTAASKVPALRPESEDYHFEQGVLTYHDTYFGARDFIGEEIVYKSGKPVWGANYYGRVLKEAVSTADAYKILRPALMQEYQDIPPVRGPREYREGDALYKNSVEGDLDHFLGVEEIYLNEELVYRGRYHGGSIQ